MLQTRSMTDRPAANARTRGHGRGRTLPQPLAACAVLAVVLVLSATRWAAAREPVPDDAAQTTAREMMRSVFSDDFARTSPADLRKLAEKLLQTGLDTRSDPAARYVLFAEARDSAVRCGDAELAVWATDALARDFEVDGTAEAVQALATIAKGTSLESRHRQVLTIVKTKVEEAMAADRYHDAGALLAVAAISMPQARDAALAKAIAQQRADVEVARQGHAAYVAALDTLRTSPDDPAANSAVGRYLCLVKGDWTAGVPYLLRCSDEKLRQLAELERQADQGGKSLLALADGWWAVGESESGLAKANARRRAADWYLLALPDLDGLRAAAARKRIEEVDALPGVVARSIPTREVDLLKLVDADRDRKAGSWRKQGAELHLGGGWASHLRFPYVPPAEYDYIVEFTRLGGDFGMGMLLVRGGEGCRWGPPGPRDAGNATFFDEFQRTGRRHEGEPCRVRNGRRYSLKVEVRSNSMRMYLDGVHVSSASAKYPAWNKMAPADMRLGLIGWHVTAVFHKVSVVEVTGRGTVTAPASLADDGGTTPRPAPGDASVTVRLRNKAGGHYLATRAYGGGEGEVLTQLPLRGSACDWRMEPMGVDAFLVRHPSRFLLCVRKGSKSPMADAIIWRQSGGDGQLWKLQGAGGGTTRVINVHSGLVLGLVGGGKGPAVCFRSSRRTTMRSAG